jgi:hypothetical protein
MDSNCRVSETQNQTVKDPLFLSGTRQNPTLVYLTRIGSTMSQGRTPTPRLGLDRLSRDIKDSRVPIFVKPQFGDFSPQISRIREHTRLACRFRRLAETRQRTDTRSQTSEVRGQMFAFLRPDGRASTLSPRPPLDGLGDSEFTLLRSCVPISSRLRS